MTSPATQKTACLVDRSLEGTPSREVAVLFDWNGTLVTDSERAWDAARSTLAVYLPRGAELLDAAAIAAEWCLPITAFFSRLGVDTEHLSDAERRWNTEMSAMPPQVRSGTTSILEWLREQNVTTGVISAAGPGMIVADLVASGIQHLIDQLHAGVVDKASAIEAARKSSGAQHVYYLGDTEEDMISAMSAGATPVAISGGYRPIEVLIASGAVAVLDTLEELKDIPGIRAS